MNTTTLTSERPSFLEELRIQRFDDHRYYHHSRINQSLHLVSALSFLTSYVLLPIDLVLAVMIAWVVAMTTRQAGHFFFEPKTYDTVNQATHEHKESIKVGYNLRRKVVLLSFWAAAPIAIAIVPDLFGLLTPATDTYGYLHNVALSWLVIGVVGVIFRTAWLCVFRGTQTGLVWATKILTDPFHDVMLYWRSPLHLLRGELIDPMNDVAMHARPHREPGV
jgi:hypothetical protein